MAYSEKEGFGFSYNVTTDTGLRAVVKNGVELDNFVSLTLSRWPLAEITVRLIYGPKEQ